MYNYNKDNLYVNDTVEWKPDKEYLVLRGTWKVDKKVYINHLRKYIPISEVTDTIEEREIDLFCNE